VTLSFRSPCCCRGGAAYCASCAAGHHEACSRASSGPLAAEELARLFHEAYERLAPGHGYQTRPESAVPWEEVPEGNRDLMVATAAAIIEELGRRGVLR
jgi:hypothetical protein